MQAIEGQFAHQIFANGGWGVGILVDDDGQEHNIVGSITLAKEGERIRCQGEFGRHPKFGKQFLVKNLEVLEDRTLAGVIGFLDRMPGLGPKLARAVIDHFGEDVFEIIEIDPQMLTKIKGISPRIANEIAEAYKLERSQRDHIVRLKGLGATDHQCAKIIQHFGNQLDHVINRRPYRLLEIDGFGWMITDRIAMASGIDRADPERIQAGLRHVLAEAENDGHCYIPKDQLLAKGCKLLQCPANNIADVIDQEITIERLVEGDNGEIYLPDLFDAEVYTAQYLMEVMYVS